MTGGPDIREHAGIYLRGLMMGACDIIPGVSGGTIALITGIYERLIGAIGSIDPASAKHLFRGDFRALFDDLEKIDIPFLVVLLAGIGTAFLAMSGVILTLLTDHAVATYSFFLGLIIASAIVLFSRSSPFAHPPSSTSQSGRASGSSSQASVTSISATPCR